MPSREILISNIRGLLARADYDGLISLCRKERPVLRLLISMTYDKADPISWRAMKAIGLITATLPVERTRNLIQRVLWMMREESGSNAWSAGEVIGEIVRENPGPFLDIVPIIVSFHDEAFLRPSVLFAMYRIARRRPDLLAGFRDVPLRYLLSEDPVERGLSILALQAIGNYPKDAIRPLLEDRATLRHFDGKVLVESTVGELAQSALRHPEG